MYRHLQILKNVAEKKIWSECKNANIHMPSKIERISEED